ncbi:response regulator transcription factor [Fulvivirga sp. 29W222]|uniref:Response regulator transcription factor n=1 Tax=Fulvivirga marina TaxID=2494733 RepID=A0A937KEV9_9BACT|nr:response regulator transcription factor [Fulvivirga marina]MBL6447605.1 response regulator transcription factor [Fulvivirga marina]
MHNSIKVCLVDDHKLLRKGMVELIDGFHTYTVVGEADNGMDLQSKIQVIEEPDILLLDINMPEMDGYETALWVRVKYPQVRILALSMYDDEKSIIKMIKAGARGYVLKDAEPTELKKAFEDIIEKGFYYSDLVSHTLVKNLESPSNENPASSNLNDREIEFIKLACTELTYKEIADKMCLAPRTIDGYRASLFEKLQVRSRVGLVMYAVKSKIVKPE